MNIIICDDKLEICQEIDKYINNHFYCKTQICTSAEMLISAVDKLKGDVQAIILDIVLGNGINGIDIAGEIHEKYPLIKIIFLTGYDDVYYKKIFSIFQPFGFITKPIQYNIMNFFLKKIELEEESKSKKLEFISDYKGISLTVNDIVYIQSRKRICEIFTEQRVYKTYLKISDLDKELTESFIRCHQSYIVNLNFTDKLNKNQLILKNGDNIPVSRKYSVAVAGLISSTRKEGIKNDR